MSLRRVMTVLLLISVSGPTAYAGDDHAGDRTVARRVARRRSVAMQRAMIMNAMLNPNGVRLEARDRDQEAQRAERRADAAIASLAEAQPTAHTTVVGVQPPVAAPSVNAAAAPARAKPLSRRAAALADSREKAAAVRATGQVMPIEGVPPTVTPRVTPITNAAGELELQLDLDGIYKTRVMRYMVENLKFTHADMAQHSATIEFVQKYANADGIITAEALRRVTSDFTARTRGILAETLRVFGKTEYPNAVERGEAGVGKSFGTMPLVAMTSFGIVPDEMKKILGLTPNGTPLYGAPRSADATTEPAPFQLMWDALVSGEVDIVKVSMELLAADPTPEGGAWPNADTRMQNVLTGLFQAAHAEFHRTDAYDRRIGRRTIFVLDEVATYPELVRQTLKKPLDATGFRNPLDELEVRKDPGFMLLAKTTQGEYHVWTGGDAASERRLEPVTVPEVSEEEAFQITRRKADGQWLETYGVNMSDDTIRFLIKMRRLFYNPPIAMPASILGISNRLILWFSGHNPKHLSTITVSDAQAYMMARLNRTATWFEGPGGEPAFRDLLTNMQAEVFGQDRVLNPLIRRIKTWRRSGMRGTPPSFLIVGRTGTGKSHTVKALSRLLYGHDGHKLRFDTANKSPADIITMFEGRSGNANPSRVALALKTIQGILHIDEITDMDPKAFDSFKVMMEDAIIPQQGLDSRSYSITDPILFTGQLGDELFDGKTDAEAQAIYDGLTTEEIMRMLRARGVPDAFLNRVQRSGGIFYLNPAMESHLAAIEDDQLEDILDSLLLTNDTLVTVSPQLRGLVTELAIKLGLGARLLDSMLSDITETAISEAQDEGLPIRDVEVVLDGHVNNDGALMVTLTSPSLSRPLEFHAQDRLFRATYDSCKAALTPGQRR